MSVITTILPHRWSGKNECRCELCIFLWFRNSHVMGKKKHAIYVKMKCRGNSFTLKNGIR
jgi:hypothetical protein